ncbi:Aste57867_4974 [Aphanomyces stellatus]|uniref:Aste57867_4974 protein n=1 Tax=Aphanomyces stellatus TaxID=120398 RepID=A0A485KDQ4_9STRA|nr:hypothetical protein As57867_004961 [Aphanomyces stellatus]VFT82062.1 Aste57867_4974 [Aphanomyces stellatus]
MLCTFRTIHTAKTVQFFPRIFCILLLCIDILANNWELIDYVGNARRFVTPHLGADTVDVIDANFIKMRDSSTYFLSMGNFLIQDATNDTCGTLAIVYPVNATTTIGSAVRLE